MVWALLAFLGVPLWLCAIAIVILVMRNRTLRKRPGDIPVRVLRPDATRWTRGHAVWVSDVFAWRASPASWHEHLEGVLAASVRPATEQEQRRLRGVGDRPVVATFTTDDGEVLQVASAGERRSDLEGPFRARVSP